MPHGDQLQRHERSQSIDSEASSQEEDRFNREMSPTSRFQEEMARSSRGSQFQTSSQRIVFQMPPTQMPALVQVATLSAIPAPAPAPAIPLAIPPAGTPAPASAAPHAIMPADPPAPAIAAQLAITPAHIPSPAIAEPLPTVPTATPAPVLVASLPNTAANTPGVALAAPLVSTAVDTPAPIQAAPPPIMPADTQAITPAITPAATSAPTAIPIIVPTPAAPLPIMAAATPASTPAATSAPTAIPNAVPIQAAAPAPLNASVEHPAQTSLVSGSANQNGGSLVREPSRVKKVVILKRLLKRLLVVLAGLGSLWVIGVPTYNIRYFPQGPAVAGFRTPSGEFVVQQTGHGANLLSELRLEVFNSSHDMRDGLLEHIYTARVGNTRADDSAQTFHRQALDWSSYIAGLQHELTSIEGTAGNRMLKAKDTIRFLIIPGNAKPHNLFSLNETPDEAIRQRILKEQKDLLDSFENVNSSAAQYHSDVDSWKTSVEGMDAAIGPIKHKFAGQKSNIAKQAFKFKTKHQEETLLEEARRTDEHVMQMQDTDNLTCRTMKHVDRVQQGSDFAMSKLKEIHRVLTELMLDCSTDGVCWKFPDELKMLGANDEEVAKYWEELEEKEDERCRQDEEDENFEEGYLACVVM